MPSWVVAGTENASSDLPKHPSGSFETLQTSPEQLAVDFSNGGPPLAAAPSTIVEAARLQLKAQRSEWASRAWKMTRSHFGRDGPLADASDEREKAGAALAPAAGMKGAAAVEDPSCEPAPAAPEGLAARGASAMTSRAVPASTHCSSSSVDSARCFSAHRPGPSFHEPRPAPLRDDPRVRAPLPPRRGASPSQPAASPPPLVALSRRETMAQSAPQSCSHTPAQSRITTLESDAKCTSLAGMHHAAPRAVPARATHAHASTPGFLGPAPATPIRADSAVERGCHTSCHDRAPLLATCTTAEEQVDEISELLALVAGHEVFPRASCGAPQLRESDAPPMQSAKPSLQVGRSTAAGQVVTREGVTGRRRGVRGEVGVTWSAAPDTKTVQRGIQEEVAHGSLAEWPGSARAQLCGEEAQLLLDVLCEMDGDAPTEPAATSAPKPWRQHAPQPASEAAAKRRAPKSSFINVARGPLVSKPPNCS